MGLMTVAAGWALSTWPDHSGCSAQTRQEQGPEQSPHLVPTSLLRSLPSQPCRAGGTGGRAAPRAHCSVLPELHCSQPFPRPHYPPAYTPGMESAVLGSTPALTMGLWGKAFLTTDSRKPCFSCDCRVSLSQAVVEVPSAPLRQGPGFRLPGPRLP